MRSSTLCPPLFRLAAIIATVAISLCAPARATIQDAQTMLQQGKRAQALDHLDQLITADPKAHSARFLKGVILTEMNKLDEAANVFLKLTEDAPDLPEPYNNLAVIYAQQKHYDKARVALEMAIRAHPSYAVAYENLGDLYARMAQQAYDRALQLDAGNASAQTKLKLVRNIISKGSHTATAPVPSSIRAATAVTPAAAPSATQATRPVSRQIQEERVGR